MIPEYYFLLQLHNFQSPANKKSWVPQENCEYWLQYSLVKKNNIGLISVCFMES